MIRLDVRMTLPSQPAHDLYRLYRLMVFNVLIGNTDDHLKNFLMLHDDAGWRLSPAYDLIPNIGFNREHVLRIGLDSRPPDFENLNDRAAAEEDPIRFLKSFVKKGSLLMKRRNCPNFSLIFK